MLGERMDLNKCYMELDSSPVTMTMPISVRCRTCGNYINRGTKLNSRREVVFDDDSIKTYRFSFNCSKCSAQIVLLKNPKTAATLIQSGAIRNLDPDPWLSDHYEKEREKEREVEKKLEEHEKRVRALLKIILEASPNYAQKGIHDGQDLADDADGEIRIIDLKRKKVSEETSIHNSSPPEEKRRRTRSNLTMKSKLIMARAREFFLMEAIEFQQSTVLLQCEHLLVSILRSYVYDLLFER